jgi:hypothetical protein
MAESAGSINDPAAASQSRRIVWARRQDMTCFQDAARQPPLLSTGPQADCAKLNIMRSVKRVLLSGNAFDVHM